MILELPYGHDVLRVEIPDAGVRVFPPPVGDGELGEREVVARALDRPLGDVSLQGLCRGARRASILISGKDRVAGARVYLPTLVERLTSSGLSPEQIEIVCATGTHARHTPEDIRALLGEEVASQVRFRPHDCDGADGFVDLGSTSRGTRVWVDRGVVESGVRILTGRITHHYFAGFSGGRKSILPGVSARETIVANHRLVLDFDHGLRVHPAVFGGNLLGNPVHEDMLEAARKLGPVFVLNTLLDSRHRLTHAFAGELEAAHQAGCAVADELAFAEVRRQVPLVIASAGGHPYDLNFIQGVKALFNHQDAVAPRGVFILVAESGGGILRGMSQWMSWADRGSLGAAIQSSYNLAAHNSLMLRDLLDSVTVVLVSALPADQVRTLGLVPMPGLAEALRFARALVGDEPETLVIPHANVTMSGCRRGALQAARALSQERCAS